MNDLRRDYDLRRVPPHLLASLELCAGALEPVDVFAPVLAVTVTRASGDGLEVLFAVRDPEDNLTHPNVLSSPTRRIRGQHHQVALLGASATAGDLLTVPGWLETEVAALLTSKVGLRAADAFRARSVAVQVWQAASIIGINGEEVVAENLTMVNVHVHIGADVVVPTRTASHTYQGFAPLGLHRIAYHERDSTLLLGVHDAGSQPIVYGICTASTSAMLDLIGTPTATELLKSPVR